jgi:hypothetical protein
MKHRQEKTLLILITCLATIVFTLPVANAKVSSIRTVDTIRLNEAGNLISSKHYYSGYVKFKNMAKHGCPFSQCIVGLMYQKGLGVKKSSAQALYWFQKSAQQGFADAEHRLGLMYYHGDGVTKNLTLARQWLSKAADHGVEGAKQLLSQIPHGNDVSNSFGQIPSKTIGTIDNLRQSWQGYSGVTQQIEQLSSIASSK